jgi:hypothetical protein
MALLLGGTRCAALFYEKSVLYNDCESRRGTLCCDRPLQSQAPAVASILVKPNYCLDCHMIHDHLAGQPTSGVP